MELCALCYESEIVGVRVVFPEVNRAYDISLNLFERYNDTFQVDSISKRLNLVPVSKSPNGGIKWVTDDEMSSGCGKIRNYIELQYDTEVCNLVDFISRYPNIIFERSRYLNKDGYAWLITDIDCSQGELLLWKDTGISPYGDTIKIKDIDGSCLNF